MSVLDKFTTILMRKTYEPELTGNSRQHISKAKHALEKKTQSFGDKDHYLSANNGTGI